MFLGFSAIVNPSQHPTVSNLNVSIEKLVAVLFYKIYRFNKGEGIDPMEIKKKKFTQKNERGEK